MALLSYLAHAATDILDVTAHGLVTGAGPFVGIAPGGTLGGISDATPYYAIVVDANHLKLATSQANALGGIAVDVTLDHYGTLGVGLPFVRARSYVPNVSQVAAADLNAFQDAEIKRQFGLTYHVIPAIAFAKYTGAATLSAGKWVGVGTFLATLPATPGTKLHWARYDFNRAGAGSLTFLLAQHKILPPFATTSFAPAAIAAGTGEQSLVYDDNSIDVSAADSVLPGNSAWTIQIDHTNAANELLGVVVALSRSL